MCDASLSLESSPFRELQGFLCPRPFFSLSNKLIMKYIPGISQNSFFSTSSFEVELAGVFLLRKNVIFSIFEKA